MRQGVARSVLVCRAFLYLCYVDWLLHRSFASLLKALQQARVRAQRGDGREAAALRAIDLASALYPKRVMCLQRSAATVLLLRTAGVDAQCVIGYRPVPVQSHAWVEREGQVINDLPQYKTKFLEIVRA